MSAHTASQPDTTNVRPPAYPRASRARPVFEQGSPGTGSWRRDRATARQTAVIVVACPSHAIHRVVGSGRRQQTRYSPVPSVIVLHVQQENARSTGCS